MIRRPPRSPLFPSPTLFRSTVSGGSFTYGGGNLDGPGTLVLSGVNPANFAKPHTLGSIIMSNSTAGFASDQSTDRKSTRLNSSHLVISYAVFCLKKKQHLAQAVEAQCVGPKALDHAERVEHVPQRLRHLLFLQQQEAVDDQVLRRLLTGRQPHPR